MAASFISNQRVMSAIGTKRTIQLRGRLSAFGPKRTKPDFGQRHLSAYEFKADMVRSGETFQSHGRCLSLGTRVHSATTIKKEYSHVVKYLSIYLNTSVCGAERSFGLLRTCHSDLLSQNVS